MMNGVALVLLLTSLVSASFWSPPPDEHNPNPNVIIKEGHQSVVVEYDQEGKDGNTKVSISPQYHHQTDDSKEEISTAERVGARELVCDAFGKCKHKIASVLGKAEDQTKEGVSKGVGKAKEVAGEEGGKLKDAIHNVKESDIVKKPTRAMEDIGMKDGGHRMTETAKRAGGLASDGLKGGAHMVREMAEKTSIKTRRSNITRSVKEMFSHSGGINSMMGAVHLLGFSIAFGMSMWVTFASSYILGDALPRQQFGMLQSKVYPVYFKAQSCSIGVAFIALLCGRRILSNRWEVINVTNLVIAVLLSSLNLLYLEPRATKVMFQRVKLEKDGGRGRVTSRLSSGISDGAGEPVTATTERQEEVQPETQTSALSEKLRTLNRLSSYVNVMTLMSLSLHLVYLGHKIRVN